VGWDGEVYEVFSIEALEGTGVRYRLVPWDHRHVIRRIEPYDETSEAVRIAHRAGLEAATRKRTLSILFSPLLGHLPGAVQRRMEGEYGAPAVGMTIASALPLFAIGILVVVAARIAAFGGEPIVPEWMIAHIAIFTYLLLESALRLYSGFVLGEPMGSVAGWIAHSVWSAARSPRASAPRPAGGSDARPANRSLNDRYTMLEPVLSLLPEADQESLERQFAFDPIRWGRLTAACILFVAGANVAISVFAFLTRTDGFLDFASLLVGGFFVWEQIVRRRRIREGKPAGSVLGVLVHPLARPLLEAARS
jgi:hypothetical protein